MLKTNLGPEVGPSGSPPTREKLDLLSLVFGVVAVEECGEGVAGDGGVGVEAAVWVAGGDAFL